MSNQNVERKGIQKFRANTERAYAKAFASIQAGIGSPEKLYELLGSQSREKVVETYVIQQYGLEKSLHTIASELEVSDSFVMNFIDPTQRRDRGYMMHNEEYKRELIRRAHSPVANKKRANSVRESWKKQTEKVELRRKHLDDLKRSNKERAEAKIKAALGNDVETTIRRLVVIEKVTDREIARETGLSEQTIRDLRNKLKLTPVRRGYGVSEEDRQIAKAAIEKTYLKTLSETERDSVIKDVIQNRFVAKPETQLIVIAARHSLTKSRIGQIQSDVLKDMKIYLKKE